MKRPHNIAFPRDMPLSYDMMSLIALDMDILFVIETAKTNSVFYRIVGSNTFWLSRVYRDFGHITKVSELLDLAKTVKKYDHMRLFKNMRFGLFDDEHVYIQQEVLFPKTPARGYYYVIRKLLLNYRRLYPCLSIYPPLYRLWESYNLKQAAPLFIIGEMMRRGYCKKINGVPVIG